MGNWNRRYQPRKKYRNYEYEDPPSSPPKTYNTHSYSSSGIENNRVPSWEIDYCNSARVPWHKVLASKKYIVCYPSVLNWDASAGKEALQDAKQRYWAMINGFPCDNPLPDPDMYVDEVDWNPFIDPELMEDLDLQVIDPDDMQNIDKLETISEEVGCVQAQYNTNQSTNYNPWESNNVQGTVSVKDTVQGWSRWDDSVNLKNDNPWEQSCNKPADSLKNDNPWEQSCNKPADSLKDNAWRSGNESWGWNEGTDNNRSSSFVDYGPDNSCNYFSQRVAVRQEGWGNRENNTWRRGNESWGKRESEYWDSRRSRQGGRSFRGGCRKRESSVQHTSKYKSSRYQSDAYGDSRKF
ncbi:hypothetical protein BUALT_Bualt01G0159300 [Buddleja alternifolia]|uniref:Uncharacterized protein n=1 Tax=Buddleja alternifolia TaxID=168488 RepID=A0AAV6Y8K7_9LAMI|nr:hypothetical protein BUALT_Bualt01G0159300 [Buddleja alternifolia]